MMPDQKDPRVDAYIAKAQPFAQPILTWLRKTVHAACPPVQESIKWGMPCFMLEGRILAHMAAFKSHCAFGFGYGDRVLSTGMEGEAMGQFGRITSQQDLPRASELKALVKQARALIDAGVKFPRAPKSGQRQAAPAVPADLAAALARLPAARRHFEAFTPSQQRGYVDWLEEAKRESTRQRRQAQAVDWIGEGKRRNWKYEAC